MPDENIGKFIKSQREKNKISQTKLAELLFVDRTLISKWENNKLTPNIKEIIKMAKIFGISIEEFLSAEEYNNDNKEIIENNLSNYLIEQDDKLIKFKKLVNGLISISTILLLTFLIYYFYQTYNKTRVYRISGVTENYGFNSGILLITRGKSYLKIGNFDSNIEKIKIYYKLNDEEKVIYEGDANDVKIDYTGYDASINLHNFNKMKDNIYMYIYSKKGKNEDMHLSFEEDFANKKLVYIDSNNGMEYEEERKVVEIPSKIKKYFECDEDMCVKNEDGIEMSYHISGGSLYLKKSNEFITYKIIEEDFTYQNGDKHYKVINGNINCENMNCKEAEKTYNHYNKYILKYIEKR